MKHSMVYFLTGISLMTSTAALANNLPKTVGVQVPISETELPQSIVGWSAKRQILGKTVFNEKNEKIGVIDDIVISPDKQVSYAIIGAGGFLGVAKHDVSISINHFQRRGEKFVIIGLTKAILEKTPEFQYTAP